MTDGGAIRGHLVDAQSRCIHWNSPLDIIGLKFKCCHQFYACYSCHQELNGHTCQKYDLLEEPHEKVVMCGVCHHRLSFQEYSEDLSCPSCNSAFNPGCKLHYHLYFENAKELIK